MHFSFSAPVKMNICHWIEIFQYMYVVVHAQLPTDVKRHTHHRRQSEEITFPQDESLCHPPNKCVPLIVCAVFNDRAVNLTPGNIAFLKSVACGYSGNTPLVCCPVIPIDPDKVKCGEGGNTDLRVVGGANADLANWPWAVAIFVDEGAGSPNITCGGSLINQNYILTAAHCILNEGGKQIPISKFSVRIGDLDLDDDDDGAYPITRRLTKAIAHPAFNLSNFHNDVALLHLESPVGYTSQIKPICFPTKRDVEKTFENEGSVLVGWGTIGFDKNVSSHLQFIQIPIQPQNVCVKAYAPFRLSHPIISSQMCAGSLKGMKDACQGDSGGPLVVFDLDRNAWQLVGVVSYGLKCAEPGFPGIYTRVTSFLDWVEENILPTTTM